MDNAVNVWFADISQVISGKTIVEVYKKYREYLEGLK